MSRDLSNITIESISEDVVYPFFATELRFDDNIVRMWTGQGTLVLEDGTEWIGFGTFQQGSILQETGNYILLEGGGRINLESMSTGFNELFSGYMDQMNIEEAGDTATIEMAVENKLIDLERARVARFTSGYQKSVYPGDLGCDFIEDLQDKKISWGRAESSG